MKDYRRISTLHTIAICDICGKENDMSLYGVNIHKNGKDYFR